MTNVTPPSPFSPAPAHTGIYSGRVMHHRLRPKRHRFVYRVCAFLFDLDHLEALAKRCRWFSLNRFNLFSLRFSDLGEGNGEHPRDHLARTLVDQGLSQPLTRASLLCYPRILGYAFNPLAVYFCYTFSCTNSHSHTTHERLFAVVYEVTNTFGQRHRYVVPVRESQRAGPIHQEGDKRLYVSPFMGMAQRYHFRVVPPGERVSIGIRLSELGSPMMTALFQGEYRPFCDRQLLKSFLAMPAMTLKVTAAIHWEALKLWLKGLPLQRRPDAEKYSVSLEQSRTES